MSVLQEYENIHRTMGEEKYARIMKYLDEHPSILYSDVLYKKSAWNKFVAWEKKNYKDPIATVYDTDKKHPGLPF